MRSNYDGLEPPIIHVHTKFLGNQPTGSREEDCCRVFTIYGDQDIAIKLLMPLLNNFNLIIKAVSEKKIFGIVDDRRTDDGLTPDHGHPISSPCVPSAQVS